jgi:hypothetical protein
MATAAAVVTSGVAVLGYLNSRKQAKAIQQQNNEYYIQQIQQQNAANDAARAHAQHMIGVAHANAAAQGAYAGQLRQMAHQMGGIADATRETADKQREAAEGMRDVAEETRGVAGEIREAADEARDLAYANAENIKMEGKEGVRRERIQHKQVEAIVVARQAASGVIASKGSAKKFYNATVKQNDLVRFWMNKAWQSRMRIEQQRGDYERQLGNIQADQTLVQASQYDVQADQMDIQADQIDIQADQIDVQALGYLAQADHTEAMAHIGIMEASAHMAGIPANQPIPTSGNKPGGSSGSRNTTRPPAGYGSEGGR